MKYQIISKTYFLVKMSSFNDICSKLSACENKLFRNFIESKTFVQSPHYDLVKQNFIALNGNKKTYDKTPQLVQNAGKSKNMYNIKVVTYNTIHEVFLELVEPGYSMSSKETTIDFCIILDKYKHLLKEVTSRHVLLHNNISAYVNRSSGKLFDTSYLNKDFMSFWGCLLNADIYVFDCNKKMYHSYLCKNMNASENMNFVIIKRSVAEYKQTEYTIFEFVDTTHMNSFETYNQMMEYNKAFDVNKLHLLKVDELRTICQNLKITNMPSKTNKADLVNTIRNVF